MRYRLFIIAKLVILFGIILPFGVFAETGDAKCSPIGYSVLTINGIFTNKEEAAKNKRSLEDKLDKTFNSQPITVDYLHNPSHLGGIGDVAKVVYQKIFEDETVLDYDLVEMLKDASEKVKTQKLLLVAHSQGNFYANSFYDTVVGKEGGVPAESIGIYSVATPASRVAGEGLWLTSDTDKIIADLVAMMPFKKIMPPNTSIVLAEGDDSNGHNFSGVYLKRRSSQIISDIQFSLDKLQTNNTRGESPCLAPPKLTLAHKATGVIFSAVDPLAETGIESIVVASSAIYQAGKALAKGAYSLTSLIAGAGASLLEEDEKLPTKTYSLWVGAEDHSQPATLTVDKPASSADRFKQAEESLQVLQNQILALENQPPSRRNLDGGSSSESNPMSRRSLDIEQPRFIVAIIPGFGGGGTGTIENSSSSSSSTSSADSSSSSSESSSSVSSSSSSSDTTPPVISSLAISECQNSLSSDGCLVAAAALNIAWNSTSSDLDYFIINNNGSVSATTSTSTIAIAPDNAVFSFAVSARDSAGNYSATSTQTAEISTRPVVINEVAWAGNGASYSADEWIELYNRTSQSINLSDWILYSKTDLSPYASLSGTISSRGYYLLERTNDDTVSNLTADKIYTGDLVNSGENLALVYQPTGQATTTIDEIPYDANWYAGSSNYYSMERYDPDTAGTNSLNWGTNNAVIFNGQNAGGGNLNGTPKARNSYNYLVNRGQNVSTNLTLAASLSPYLVDNTIQTFSASSTLTVEPGVTIKFYNGAGWQFTTGAKILAQGTTANPIVFTSFYDDDYGGDTNNDGAVSSPSYGDWFGLRIDSPGTESVISRAVFRYGGRAWPDSLANLYIANSSASVSDSVFEYGKAYGARLSSASSTFSGNIFRSNNNSQEGGSTGLYSEGGNLTINSNAFSGNKRGLYVLGTNSAGVANVNSNTFTSNTNEAVYSYGRLGSYSNNSGSGNGVDAISINGTITQTGATTTLLANSLPYLLNGNVIVSANSALAVNSGLALKGWSTGSTSYLDVYGSLVVSGANFPDIVFGALSASPSKGLWGGVRLYSGSYSTISGATFEYANTAISYADSPINLSNIKFNENNLGLSADSASRAYPINASSITFTSNTATTSPGGLW